MSRAAAIAQDQSAAKCELAVQVLRSFGTLRFAATGWSMLPSVWPGETLVVERVRQDQVRIGDIVLLKRQGGFCAHRVVEKVDGADAESLPWITQGDALPVPDCPVAGSQLLGRVTYLIRGGKLVTVPSELGVIDTIISRVVRRSVPAARALVYLNGMRRTRQA
jgi:hypothetical protein